MSALPAVIEWFRSDPLPGVLPDPIIVAGGTVLLPEFLAIVASRDSGGELSVATAFVGDAGECDLPALKLLPHRHIDLRLVTSGAADAQRFMDHFGGLPWRSLVIRIHSRLHAKMYTFITPQGGGACLIGSHNLTRCGAALNEEAGVLFSTHHHDAIVGAMIRSCHHRIDQLMHEAEMFTDTLHWPAYRHAVTARR